MKKKTLSTTEAAEKLGISAVRMRVLCVDGRVVGAEKVGRDWRIPSPPVVMAAANPGRWQTKVKMRKVRK